MKDDAALLRGYAENQDETAFAEFVRRRINLVYSAALRRTAGNAHAAADITQLVFGAVAKRAAKLSRHAALTGWLYTATRNASLNHMREDRRRRDLEQAAGELGAATSSEEGWNQLYPVLDGAMDEISPRDREAVLLRFFEGLPFAEVGVRLNLSENAARMRVDRALERLRSRLAHRGVVATSAGLGATMAQHVIAAVPAELMLNVATSAFAGAASTGAGVSVGSALIFMKTNKILMGLAAMVTMIGLGGAGYGLKKASEAERELAIASLSREITQRRSTELEGKLRGAEEAAASATRQMAALQAALDTERKNGATASSLKASPSGNSSDGIWSRPGYAGLYVEKYRKSLGLLYGPLYRALGFSPEQIAKFEDVLVEGQQGVVDIWTEAAKRGIRTGDNSADATTVARLTSGPLGTMENDLKALLGQSGYEQYQDFHKAKSSWDLVKSLAGNLYYTEAPLTAQQGDALTRLLTASTKIVKTPMTDDGKHTLYRLAEQTDWTAVETGSQGMLTVSQLAALHGMMDQKRLDRELIEALAPHAPTAQ